MAFSEVLLNDLKSDFSRWRIVRKTGEAIPAELWLKAVCLSEMTSVAFIAKELNLNHSKLSQRFQDKLKEEKEKSPTKTPVDLTFTKLEPVDSKESSSNSVHFSCSRSASIGKIRFPGGPILYIRSLDALQCAVNCLLGQKGSK